MDPFDSNFIQVAGDLWTEATHSPFLEAAGDGTLPEEAFERWLVQDYKFALELTAFEGVLFARSGRPVHETLVQGIVAMEAELSWFEAHARARKLVLDAPIHPACRRYTDFLLRAVYEEALPGLYAVLYGVEVSYLRAWSVLRSEGPYGEFIARWSNPHFRDYVTRLRELAEESPDRTSQPLFNQVLRYEKDFWEMTWSG